MVELRGSLFTCLLPSALAGQAEVRAIAYAISHQIDKALAYSDAAQILCSIDTMPDKVLDYLANEWRTPSYDESYALDVKRQMIKDTLLIYIQMGTPAAVQRVVEATFGAGEVKEWFDYNGEPHYFKVITNNPRVDNARAAELVKAIDNVKRLSSWLDEVRTETTADTIEAGLTRACASCLYASSVQLPESEYTVHAMSAGVDVMNAAALSFSSVALAELDLPGGADMTASIGNDIAVTPFSHSVVYLAERNT